MIKSSILIDCFRWLVFRFQSGILIIFFVIFVSLFWTFWVLYFLIPIIQFSDWADRIYLSKFITTPFIKLNYFFDNFALNFLRKFIPLSTPIFFKQVPTFTKKKLQILNYWILFKLSISHLLEPY